MIEGDEAAFPNNIIQVIALFLETLVDDDPNPKTKVKVLRRSLSPTDPVQSIGVYARMWTPDEGSWEMGTSFKGQTIQRYAIQIQCYVKHFDEVKGLNAHAKMANIVRNILYRDEDLRLALGALSITIGGITERFQRMAITGSTYVSNEIDGQHNFLCTLETIFETETA